MINDAGPINSTAGFKIAGIQINANATEINRRVDDSAMVAIITAAGEINPLIGETSIALTGAGAVTLAAPSIPNFDLTLTMTADNGDVTLALTNVVGGSAATTCTFNDVNDILVLKSNLASGKWMVLKEIGVVLT